MNNRVKKYKLGDKVLIECEITAINKVYDYPKGISYMYELDEEFERQEYQIKKLVEWGKK